jgi:hypothetical protein
LGDWRIEVRKYEDKELNLLEQEKILDNHEMVFT